MKQSVYLKRHLLLKAQLVNHSYTAKSYIYFFSNTHECNPWGYNSPSFNIHPMSVLKLFS